jgi:menaquinone-dependent protoporphyrinogen oxidase
MSKLILYASKKGSTKKCAEFLHQHLEEFELSTFQAFQGKIANYDRLVLCAPVYFGQVHKHLKEFLKSNKDLISSIQTTVVLNAMNENEYDAMIERNFEEDLREHVDFVYGGGAYYFKKMNFLERFMVRKISGIKTDYESIRYEQLKKVRP